MNTLKTLVLIGIWKQSDYNIIEYTFFNIKSESIESLVVVGFAVLSDDRGLFSDYRGVLSDHSLIF